MGNLMSFISFILRQIFLQVLPIWEGTSSVMSLDVLRAINKSRGGSLLALQCRIEKIAREADHQVIQ